MQVAASRMTASLGSMMVGSSRRSTRTSLGPWRRAPRMGGVLSVVVGAEDPFGDRHGGHRLGSTGVERQVGDRFDELVLGGAVLALELLLGGPGHQGAPSENE